MLLTEKLLLDEISKIGQGLSGGAIPKRNGGATLRNSGGTREDKCDTNKFGVKTESLPESENRIRSKDEGEPKSETPKSEETVEDKWPELEGVIRTMGPKRFIIGTPEQNQKAARYFETHYVPASKESIPSYDPSIYQDDFNQNINHPGTTLSQIQSMAISLNPIKDTEHGKKLLGMLQVKAKGAKLTAERAKRKLDKY